MHVPKLWQGEQRRQPAAGRDGADTVTRWPELDVRAQRDEEAWKIVCRGNLVSDTAPALRRAVGNCVATDTEAITLDLGGVEDVDVVGLRAAIDAGETCNRHGIELTIAMPSRAYHLYCLANPSARGHAALRRRLQAGAAGAAQPQRVTVIAV